MRARAIVAACCLSLAASLLQGQLLFRGRGGVGSRVEETGPYLPAESGPGWSLISTCSHSPESHLWLAHAVNHSCIAARDSSGTSPGGTEPLGPHCPDWIRQASDQAEDVTNRLQSSGSKHQSRNDANLSTKPKGVTKHKKDKSHKKAKTKKRHKHKHNKT